MNDVEPTVAPGERAERLAFLLSEAADGPWWPERKADLWLTNAAGDSLLVGAADVADLLNAALAADVRKAQPPVRLRTSIRRLHGDYRCVFVTVPDPSKAPGDGRRYVTCGLPPEAHPVTDQGRYVNHQFCITPDLEGVK